MKPLISGLLLSAACLTLAGCALTEVVAPPPPASPALPPQAQAFLNQPIPQCAAPVIRTQAAINQQKKAIKAHHAQLESLREAELTRWDRRRAYLEDELEFYKREVRRTGGSWELTKTTEEPRPLKLSTTGNFTEQVKKQQEREYNERQYRRFYRALQRGEAKHERLLGLYQERQEALEQALAACTELSLALKKAKEDEALHRNTRAIEGFGRSDIQVVEVQPQPEALEQTTAEPLPLSASPQARLPAREAGEPLQEPAAAQDEQARAETELPEESETLEDYAEAMDELLRQALQEPAPLVARP